MEKEEFNHNDQLGKLILQIPDDSPSAGFEDRVMAVIRTSHAVVPQKTSFLSYLNAGLPYAALVLFCGVFFFNSDLPFLNSIGGRDFLPNQVVPFVNSLFYGLKSALSSKYITYGLMMGAAGVFLFFLDRVFTRRMAGG